MNKTPSVRRCASRHSCPSLLPGSITVLYVFVVIFQSSIDLLLVLFDNHTFIRTHWLSVNFISWFLGNTWNVFYGFPFCLRHGSNAGVHKTQSTAPSTRAKQQNHTCREELRCRVENTEQRRLPRAQSAQSCHEMVGIGRSISDVFCKYSHFLFWATFHQTWAWKL